MATIERSESVLCQVLNPFRASTIIELGIDSRAVFASHVR